MSRTPVVWNEVWSDPPTSEPNGALPGTIIQNWKAASAGATTAAGFNTLVSTYTCVGNSHPSRPFSVSHVCQGTSGAACAWWRRGC